MQTIVLLAPEALFYSSYEVKGNIRKHNYRQASALFTATTTAIRGCS